MSRPLVGARGISGQAAAADDGAGAVPTLVGVRPGETGTVSCNPYIPLSFEAPRGEAGPGSLHIYGPTRESLIELTMELATGRLRGATLVSYADEVRSLDGAAWRLPALEGLPLVALDGFDRQATLPRQERRAAIRLFVGRDSVLVRFGRASAQSLVRCGRARFLFADGALVGFGAEGLTSYEVADATGAG